MLLSSRCHCRYYRRCLTWREGDLQSRIPPSAAAKRASASNSRKERDPDEPPPPDETRQQPEASSSSTPSPRAVAFSPLHYNVEEFIKKVALTDDEKKVKQECIEWIRQCTNKAFPDMRGKIKVEVFGSFANGLSTWHSDVDLVVTGLFEPDRATGGYSQGDKGRVTARLRKIADQMRAGKKGSKPDVTRLSIIGRARIPIIKLRTRNNVSVDISVSDSSGPQAAQYISVQSSKFPPMRPIVLVLKSYLKAQRLNDVATGGLSSYSLCNMVVAHLQEELKCGRDIFDLGETLYSFLLRFGEEFDYERDAVSIKSGGIVPKRTLPFASDGARFAAAAQGFGLSDSGARWDDRLLVDCPLSGRDVSNGTYRIDVVRQAFVRASRQLEALARGRSPRWVISLKVMRLNPLIMDWSRG